MTMWVNAKHQYPDLKYAGDDIEFLLRYHFGDHFYFNGIGRLLDSRELVLIQNCISCPQDCECNLDNIKMSMKDITITHWAFITIPEDEEEI